MGVCAFIVVRATIVTDITAFLPGPATAEQYLLAQQLREGVASRLMLIGIEAGSVLESPVAAKVSRELSGALRGDARFNFVANGDPAAFERERQLLFDARYLLSPQVSADSFSIEGLRAAFARLEQQLASALAPAIRQFAAADPTAELFAIAQRLTPRTPPITRHGVWFADDKTAVVIAQTGAPGFDVDAQQDAVAAVRAAFAAAASGRVQLRLAGPGVFSVESRSRIENDAQRLSLIAAVLVAALLLVTLRSPRFLLLAAVPVASGALAGFAVTAALYGSIHGITLGFGLTLIGEAADYAVYAHLQRGAPGDTDAERRLGRSLWLAVATSAAGFVAMILSGFQGLTQLGVFSLVGIVVAGAIARWLLPTVLPPSRSIGSAIDWPPASRNWPRVMQLIVVACVGASVVLLATRGASVWNDNLVALSPLPAGSGDLDVKLRSGAALPELRWVIALARPAREAALQAAEGIRPRLDSLRAAGVIAGFDSPADWLPSARAQAERRAALPDGADLQRRMNAALAGSNFVPEAFAPFVQAVERARAAPDVTPAYYDGSALGQRLAAQLARNADTTTVLITLHGADGSRAAMLRDETKAAGATLVDLKEVEDLVADYRRKAVWAALGGALLIILLLSVRLRDARALVRIALALAAAVMMTIGTLLLLEDGLTLFHLVALLLVVGVGSNYAMFFCRLPADARLRRGTLASVALAAATTLIAFALLAVSATPVLHMIGETVALGATAAFFASAALAALERR